MAKRSISPTRFQGQPWSAWTDYIGRTSPVETAEDVAMRRKAMANSAVMRLPKKDMDLFGLCPATEPFSVVVCEMCSAVIKPQGLRNHMELRHCVTNGVVDPPLPPAQKKIATKVAKPILKSTKSKVRLKTYSVVFAKADSTTKAAVNSDMVVSMSTGMPEAGIVDSSVSSTSTGGAKAAVTVAVAVAVASPISPAVQGPLLAVGLSSGEEADSPVSSTCLPAQTEIIATTMTLAEAVKQAVEVASIPMSPPRPVMSSPVPVCITPQNIPSPTLGGSKPRRNDWKSLTIKQAVEVASIPMSPPRPVMSSPVPGGITPQNISSPMLGGSKPRRNDWKSLTIKQAVEVASIPMSPPRPVMSSPVPVGITPQNIPSPILGGSKPRRNDRKSLTIKEKEYDADRHCGVVVPDMKPCTRSLTCRLHSIVLRKSVDGRSKPFELLLAEHRATKEALLRQKKKTEVDSFSEPALVCTPVQSQSLQSIIVKENANCVRLTGSTGAVVNGVGPPEMGIRLPISLLSPITAAQQPTEIMTAAVSIAPDVSNTPRFIASKTSFISRIPEPAETAIPNPISTNVDITFSRAAPKRLSVNLFSAAKFGGLQYPNRKLQMARQCLERLENIENLY